MRLAFLLELVLAVGVGLALDRASRNETYTPLLQVHANWVEAARDACDFGGHLLAGIGLVVGLGTWLEAARRRGPKPWGPGRWVWSVMAGFLLWAAALWSASYVYVVSQPHGREYANDLVRNLADTDSDRFLVTSAGILIAVVATRRLAGVVHGPTPDAREWAGRIYLAVLLLMAGVGWVANLVS